MDTNPESSAKAAIEHSEPIMDSLTRRVLELRSDRSARSALRLAQHPRTRYNAIPLIGGYVGHSANEAAFRFSALCASFDKVRNQPRLSLGRALQRSDPKRGDPEGPIARRLFALQRQPLVIADTTIRSLLNIAEPHSVDWNELLWALREWDQQDLLRRVQVRERLLRDFYVNPSNDNRTSDTTTDESEGHS